MPNIILKTTRKIMFTKIKYWYIQMNTDIRL